MDWVDGSKMQTERRASAGAVSMVGPLPSGRAEAVRPGPQAFLALLPASPYTLATHYHRVDQFQLIVDGHATMANHPVAFGSVHFSDRCQPYGPIRPDEGLSFLTLRPLTGGGVFYMPESRDLLARELKSLPEQVSARRNLTFDVMSSAPGTCHADDDGLRVSVVVAGAGETAPSETVGGAGAYAIVVDGSLAVGEGELGVGSLRWFEAGERTRPFTAGEQGVRVALLQYPDKAPLPTGGEAPSLSAVSAS